MTSDPSPFLTAKWLHLAMLNFRVDPAVLQPLVPTGTELDDWEGHTYVSVVGFLFLNTRVLGVPVPWHRNFEEVNLRFYVRRKGPEGWRRGVVFIKELVPRWAIAFVARMVYGENYVSLPMSHRVGEAADGGSGTDARSQTVSYSWRLDGSDNHLGVTVNGPPEEPTEGSIEEFITEHYWGYAGRKDGGTTEYRVEHPRWKVFQATSAQLDCDVAALYGEEYVEFMREPESAFLADGSDVTVFKGRRLA